jgi:hypothetical protein
VEYLRGGETVPKSDGWKNLKPMNERTKEERQEIGRRGGLAYGENQKRRQTMQDCMRALLELTMSKDKARKDIGDIAEYASDNPTLLEILNLVQIREAQNGNTKAFELVRDSAGYKPIDRQEITADIMTENDRKLLEKVAARMGIDGENTQ